MTARVWMLLFSLSFIWGGTFFLTEILLEEMRPFQIVFHRVSIAAVTMMGVLALMGKRLPRDRQSWMALGVMGLLNNAIPFSAIVFGQQYITGGLASILNSTTAFFGVMLSGLLLSDERITAAKFTGVVMGVVGVSIVMGVENLMHLSLSSIGQLLIILASVSYALASIWGKLQVKTMGVEVTATGMLISSSVWMLILATAIEGVPIAALSMKSSVSIFTMAVICTSMAYLLYFRILALAGAGNLMLVTIIIPPFTLVLNAFALGEMVSAQEVLGFGVIALGLLIISGKIPLLKG
ncbi:MAG: DMT family transporter [Alphaproteobacteria bacterium]|nr:DMT family transporter [Alphaproteobacteria bacterium]